MYMYIGLHRIVFYDSRIMIQARILAKLRRPQEYIDPVPVKFEKMVNHFDNHIYITQSTLLLN